ncbi:Mycocerosic acid synthase [Rosistilla ulvae]|uniref:Mycocerosic acid synthase n=1 Tax=Rosistilla ulvae TaxID=1930277 RepID=A0A517LTR3_9BACT|nr:type I polyketide synthase [Rosistilla ulvae]QDS86006.1 Mycocerosic acid synthase [Rosistilla ulvae]
MTQRNQTTQRQPLALVGLGCRLPGGIRDPDSLWQLLARRGSAISDVPGDRWHIDRYFHEDPNSAGHMTARRGGFVDQLKQFDATFWGFSRREAVRLDPQQRWMLEVAWEACEDAGIPPSSLRGTNVGVFVGASSHDYGSLQLNDLGNLDVHSNTGGTLSIVANRISYLFDLRGPSLAVDTACSSALVAFSMACRSIWLGECDAALTGGVNALLTPNASIGFSKASMLSAAGECFAFDHRADGYVRSEGAGMVLLKPLADAIDNGDHIYAVVRSAVVNQDGHTSSMTVPSSAAQSKLLRRALDEAGVAPSEVCYVEAHGTGTPVGDPIEAAAIGAVVSKGRAAGDDCWLGSIKTNLGHLEPASGIAGLFKLALIMDRQSIPPSGNFEAANPAIPFDSLQLKVVDGLQPIATQDQPISAAINSFGFGGTNASAVVQSAPQTKQHKSSSEKIATRPFLLPISARDDEALRGYAKQYSRQLKEFGGDDSAALADFCYSAGTRKEQHSQRMVLRGRDAKQLAGNLRAWLRGDDVEESVVVGHAETQPGTNAFVFTGQGSQWATMGQDLIAREPIVAATIDKIDTLFQQVSGWSLKEAMLCDASESKIDSTQVAQPAIFALQVALVELWKTWGITPDSVIGHSVGEVAAAWCAGIYTLDEATQLVYHRSRLQDGTGGAGKMLAVGMTVAEARALIGDAAAEVTAVNSPSLVTIGGDAQTVADLEVQLKQVGKFVRDLGLDYAFHTYQMDAIKEPLLQALEFLNPQPSTIPFISTVTGRPQDGQTMDAQYWWHNVRQPVLFDEGFAALVAAGHGNFLEIGPHPALRSSMGECLASLDASAQVFHSLARQTDSTTTLLKNVAQMHVAGLSVDWQVLNQSTGNFVPQPRYPWTYQEYWLDKGRDLARLDKPLHPLLGKRLQSANPTWQLTLDPHRFPYLRDHQIWDGIVFPAAGFAEIGFAVADAMLPGDAYVVEDLQCLEALFVDPDLMPTIQVVFEEQTKSFSIHSSTDKQNWQTNACGRLVLLPADPIQPKPNLQAIESRLPCSVSHENLYDNLHRSGYGFGDAFSLIQHLRHGEPASLSETSFDGSPLRRESLAWVDASGLGASAATEYRWHPAILDACLQATHGTQYAEADAEQGDDFYLPESIRRVHLYCNSLPLQFWVHAVQTAAESDCFECDLFVIDSAGQTIAEIQGFRVAKVQRTGVTRPIDDCLYRFQWQPQRIRGTQATGACDFPTSSELLRPVESQAADLVDQYGLGDYYADFLPRMQQVVIACIVNALRQLGWSYQAGDRFTADQLMEALGIVEEHAQLLQAQLHWLADAGVIAADGSGWRATTTLATRDTKELLADLAEEYPRFAAEVDLVTASCLRLADVMSGEIDPLELLFPSGSSHLVDHFYTQGCDFPAFNQLLKSVVGQSVANLPPRRTVRVLEIGAGTGSLTGQIVQTLPADRFEYLFTDIGGAFLADAKQRFDDCPAMEYQLFDLQRPAEDQGIELHSFDIVIATNVLHATEDLSVALANAKSCLAAEGLFIFLEVVERRPIWDNVFGLLKGWWSFQDAHRSDSPLLSRDAWEALLQQSGFQDVASFKCADDAEQAVFIAHAPETQSVSADADSMARQDDVEPSSDAITLMFVGEDPVSTELALQWDRELGEVVRVRRGAQYQQTSENEFTVVDGSVDELQRLFHDARLGDRTVEKIVHGWGLSTAASALDIDRLLDAQKVGVLSCMHLAQALGDWNLSPQPRVHVLTRGAQSTSDTDRVDGLAASPLVGFCRVARSEVFDLGWQLIDLDVEPNADDVANTVDELRAAEPEAEVALRGTSRLVNRLHRANAAGLPTRQFDWNAGGPTSRAYRLQMQKTGVLEDLSLNETDRRSPQPDEIEVQVMAGGINFRDVMKALGMYPGNSIDLLWFGDDFAGVVERVGENVDSIQPGDRVCGIAGYSFQSHLVVDHRMVFKLPPELSFAQAATVPTAFMTAEVAIGRIARLRAGEKILIHAAAGGVGQAAVQTAQHLGLEIFATAGTPEKRELLKRMGVAHVMDSRNVRFADEIMQLTDGAGVDAVLNSLAGEFVPKSLSVLAPFGRFLEIGKVDVYGNSKIGLAALKHNISYHVIDLAQIIDQRPAEIANVLRELSDRFAAGDYQPLPLTQFPISEAAEAFRYMAQGQHIGKNILSFESPASDAATGRRIVGPCTQEGHLFKADATYLITGGARGFGFEVAKWMASQGARNLVLMSRSGPDQASSDAIQRMRDEGICVVDARGDVTDAEAANRVIDTIQADMPELKGVLHAAMVLDDEFISELDVQRFNRVLQPKMLGAWNLHQATLELPLDHFICFSSFSAVIGAPKQSNYNAGNSFLDALAGYRHARNLPGLTVNWGAILGAGFVDRNQKTAEYLDTLGMQAFPVGKALDLLGQLLQRDVPLLSAARVDWQRLSKLSPAITRLPVYAGVVNERGSSRCGSSLPEELKAMPADQWPAFLEDFVAQQVAGVFGSQDQDVDRTRSLTTLGIDSLMAVELVNRLETAAGIRIPMGGLLGGVNVRELSVLLQQQLLERIAVEPQRGEGPTPTEVPSKGIDFERDAALDDSVLPAAKHCSCGPPAKVLLTGATGFIGAHLLHELLETTDSEITCLVRARDLESGMQRIVDNLAKYRLCPNGAADRVKIQLGDIAQPQLGLSTEAFSRLADEMDVLYHNAASPNLMLPYDALHGPNVVGTQEMLRLACHNKTKPLHYVSTFMVHGTDANRGCDVAESDLLPRCEDLIYGYAQTKWVAEKMIETARQRGLPVTIYRPGHVTGHSETGVANVDDLLHTIVRACVSVGAAPFRSLQLDITPVDFVARAIVALSQHDANLGQTFHLTNPQPLSDEVLVNWMHSIGSQVDLISHEEWCQRIDDKTSDHDASLEVLTEVLMPRLTSGGKRGIHPQFDCKRTLDALAGSGILCPPADEQLLSTCYAYLLENGAVDDSSAVC